VKGEWKESLEFGAGHNGIGGGQSLVLKRNQGNIGLPCAKEVVQSYPLKSGEFHDKEKVKGLRRDRLSRLVLWHRKKRALASQTGDSGLSRAGGGRVENRP